MDFDLYKTGEEIISVEYESDQEATWYFGGFINETTIAIHIVSNAVSGPFYFQVKKGQKLILPEFHVSDPANLHYKIVDIIPAENLIKLKEL
jgi:hypothetical protein